MTTITISWNIAAYVLILVCSFIFAITRDDNPGWFGSSKDLAQLLWVLLTIVFTAIWGGVFWW
ncbi:MAG: hypothetical protein RR319_01270 [Bacteroides sp.]